MNVGSINHSQASPWWGRVILAITMMGFLTGSGLLSPQALAQGASPGVAANPSAAEIAEQLRPKTRSLGQKRNLVISKEPESAAAPATTGSAGLAAPSAAPAVAGTAAGAATGAAAAASVAESQAAPGIVPASISLLIQFDFNSAKLLPEGETVLAELAKAMNAEDLKQDRFMLEGHTDAKGSREVNLRLSKQRAEAVRSFLMKNGIDTRRLRTEGYGSSRLANSADPFAAENRRVRVVNLE